MVKHRFVPIFFRNLWGCDSNFIVTQLGFDTKKIRVIPNTEEKCIDHIR
jgi:hypothetical protein